MARSQSAALDGKKADGRSIIVTTIVVLITFHDSVHSLSAGDPAGGQLWATAASASASSSASSPCPAPRPSPTRSRSGHPRRHPLGAAPACSSPMLRVYVRVSRICRRPFQSLVSLPVVSPPFVLSLSMIMLFGKSGIITQLPARHLRQQRLRLLGIAVVQTLTFFPPCAT